MQTKTNAFSFGPSEVRTKLVKSSEEIQAESREQGRHGLKAALDRPAGIDVTITYQHRHCANMVTLASTSSKSVK